uniref:A disintegrin and metalloproteinase with n=1 Tax=Haemonchus contortus TaxID=6289 RepID=W6NE94_HAECO
MANNKNYKLVLQPTLERLVGEQFTVVHRNNKQGGRLMMNSKPTSCHYRFSSNDTYGAVSNCDGRIVSKYVLLSALE